MISKMAKPNPKNVGTKRNFISDDERAQLLKYCEAPFAPWLTTNPNDPWNDRTIPHNLARSDIRPLLRSIRDRIVQTVSKHFRLENELYSDSFSIVRWRFGDAQAPHADSENPDGTSHPYPWRAYGSIIYLNEDYTGGELEFPDLKLKPATPAKTLAFFPGTKEYMHAVSSITSGTRYTLATFLTHDATKKDMMG